MLTTLSRVLTTRGELAVGDLAEDDTLLTADNRKLPIIGIKSRAVPALGVHAPIRIGTGALGNHSDLLVSPQQRFYRPPYPIHRGFDTRFLVSAQSLVNGSDILAVVGGEVTYYLLVVESTCLIVANGIVCELMSANAAPRSRPMAVDGRPAPRPVRHQH